MQSSRSTHCGNFGPPALSRREMLQRSALGFGTIALADLLAADGLLADAPLAGPAPQTGEQEDAVRHRGAGAGRQSGRQFAGRARSVIFIFLGGGPSQVDTFDPKPLLKKLDGKRVPDSIARDIPRIARSPLTGLMASPFEFRKCGESGIEVSELAPQVGECIDDVCVIRSMRHTTPIHAPAEFLTTTGTQIGERPSLGSWLTYGLGSENCDLPGFVVLKTGETLRPPAFGTGFLPARYQGVVVDSEAGLPHAGLPKGVSRSDRIAQLELMGELNRRHLERHAGHSELEARIRAYELSFRMQMKAPQAFDVSDETAETQRLYGLDEKDTAETGRICLTARRLIERGVRFVQIRSGGWDAHSRIAEEHAKSFRETDRPIAALLTDLKRRGLLEETLVIWGGEFGRTPAAQGSGKTAGRDHSPSGYSIWLAGGGVKGGQVIGATDPVGYAAIERPIHPNDLHATILFALGIDQRALVYEHHGRQEMVTVNGGEVVREVFA